MTDRLVANSIDIHYLRTAASGRRTPSLVLLHGLMGSGAGWTPVARALEGEFDVIMPDARGHGRSSAPGDGYRYDELAGVVIGLINGLDLSHPVLVGHSMGGMTAAVVAARTAGAVIAGREAVGAIHGAVGAIHGAVSAIHNVRLGALILVDPTFLSPDRQRDVYTSDVAEQHRRALTRSRAELIVEARARHPQRSLELLEIQAEARLNTSLAAFDVLRPPAPDYRVVMQGIDIPTLLVIGDRTPVVTLDMATELASGNPHVRIAEVRDAGHAIPFEQPEALSREIAAFLHTPAVRRDADGPAGS